MRDYRQQTAGLRGAAKGLREIDMPKTAEQMEEAADAIEELQAAVPNWISVEERLPEENRNYLTYGVFKPLGVKAMDMFRFDGEHWFVNKDIEITHWMPLPEPPKEVG